MLVKWTTLTLDDIAAFYVTLSLADQDDVSQTITRMNAELSLHPERLGESREENSRIWFEGRLVVRYVIRPVAGTVTVFNAVLLRGSHR